MKYVAFVALVVVMIFVSSSDASNCIPREGTCNGKSELCSTRYCRNQKCIKFGTVYDDSETKDPCLRHDCKDDEVCTYNQVTCFRAPCGPVRNCVKKSEACRL